MRSRTRRPARARAASGSNGDRPWAIQVGVYEVDAIGVVRQELCGKSGLTGSVRSGNNITVWLHGVGHLIGFLARLAVVLAAHNDDASVGEVVLLENLVVRPLGGIELGQDVFPTGVGFSPHDGRRAYQSPGLGTSRDAFPYPHMTGRPRYCDAAA